MTKKSKPHSHQGEEPVIQESDDEAGSASDLPPEILEDTPAPEADEASIDLSRVQAQAAEYLDGWQRSRAEFANYKKRVDKEAEDARGRITAEIITHFLPVFDDLERALKGRPLEGDGAKWSDGIELIYRKLGALLDAEGIEPIPAQGERFDPMVHEALTLEDSAEHEEGVVIEVIQQGYRLGDRVLRPALVRVAK